MLCFYSVNCFSEVKDFQASMTVSKLEISDEQFYFSESHNFDIIYFLSFQPIYRKEFYLSLESHTRIQVKSIKVSNLCIQIKLFSTIFTCGCFAVQTVFFSNQIKTIRNRRLSYCALGHKITKNELCKISVLSCKLIQEHAILNAN